MVTILQTCTTLLSLASAGLVSGLDTPRFPSALSAPTPSPKFPNPYNMMDKGKARKYMDQTFGVNMYNNHMYGYKMPKYNYYPVLINAL